MTIRADPAEQGDARAPPQQVSENSNARLLKNPISLG
jgi:hypothetical protein